MKRVILHIDRLVLRGFDSNDSEGIVEGLRMQLGQLLSDPNAADGLLKSGQTPRLRLDNVRFSHGSSSEGMGSQLATGIVGGFNK